MLLLVLSDDVHLRQAVYPSVSNDAAKSVGYTGDLKNAGEKVDKLKRLMKVGVMDESVIKYLPSMAELAFKGLIYDIKNKKVSADSTYKNFKTLKFNIKLPTNQCFNWSSVHYLSSDSNKKKTNSVNNTDATMMTINNFFAH